MSADRRDDPSLLRVKQQRVVSLLKTILAVLEEHVRNHKTDPSVTARVPHEEIVHDVARYLDDLGMTVDGQRLEEMHFGLYGLWTSVTDDEAFYSLPPEAQERAVDQFGPRPNPDDPAMRRSLRSVIADLVQDMADHVRLLLHETRIVGESRSTQQEGDTGPKNQWIKVDSTYIVRFGDKRCALSGRGAERMQLLLRKKEVHIHELSGDLVGLRDSPAMTPADQVEDPGKDIGGTGVFDKTTYVEDWESLANIRNQYLEVCADLKGLPPESQLERGELETEKKKLIEYLTAGADRRGRPRIPKSEPQRQKHRVETDFKRLRKKIAKSIPALAQHLKESIRYDEATDCFCYDPAADPMWKFEEK